MDGRCRARERRRVHRVRRLQHRQRDRLGVELRVRGRGVWFCFWFWVRFWVRVRVGIRVGVDLRGIDVWVELGFWGLRFRLDFGLELRWLRFRLHVGIRF
jgi:hypothetical protein